MIKINEHGPVTEWCYTSENALIKKISKPFWTSCYVIDGLLIDTGSPSAIDDFRRFIDSDGRNSSIKMCLISHWHEDHSGGAEMLSREYGIPLYAHRITVEKITKGWKIPLYRRMAWGREVVPTYGACQLNSGSINTPGGRYSFEVVQVPGHADGQLALIEREQGWAFTADSVMNNYRMLFGGSCDIQEDIKTIHSSIGLLAGISDEITGGLKLFLSGNGVVEDGGKFLRERLEEIEELHARVHELKYQDMNEKKILKEMFGGESPVAKVSRGDFSRMNLVRSLLAWEPGTN